MSTHTPGPEESVMKRIWRLEREKAALLEALEEATDMLGSNRGNDDEDVRRFRDAIRAAKGEDSSRCGMDCEDMKAQLVDEQRANDALRAHVSRLERLLANAIGSTLQDHDDDWEDGNA